MIISGFSITQNKVVVKTLWDFVVFVCVYIYIVNKGVCILLCKWESPNLRYLCVIIYIRIYKIGYLIFLLNVEK